MTAETRKIKARDLPALLVRYTIVWDGEEVKSARAGWGPQAKKYTFYKGADGVEHRTMSAGRISVEVTDKPREVVYCEMTGIDIEECESVTGCTEDHEGH